MNTPGMKPTQPSSLVRADDRLSFLYLEHCTIGKSSSALTATDENGVIHIPSATLSVLMLGPGTRVTHQAMCVIADSGMSVIWVGEQGVRYYAHGRPIGRNTRLLEAQAKIVSNTRLRLQAARTMYEMRFEGEDTSTLTMQQLRGREGARVRKIYREMSEKHSVKWSKRDYEVGNLMASDPINIALTAAHTSLYGLVHATIVALGCSPGLGVVHTGHDRSLVYDIADLYKAEVTIPIAFEAVVAMQDLEFTIDELPTYTRRACRNAFKQSRISNRIVADLKTIFLPDEAAAAEDESWFEDSVIHLWDNLHDRVVGGTNFEFDS
ncbi:CRISPR-associated protein Cse1 [Corynebacterium phocae]|uniref:CRISPR-associated endonuclease Cas1 n=1 Tax=Corynebacterium phocae TaxID=161895 RepID=A0A1L7D5N3_9CORY|nr:type I-E CRISPR-associated endonuclease Cas1e [Corynebacterium phocae]APT93242.1 CRISPR-associated protein Cse1 [Corynebacterium phocae]KAA8721560.1 type I-E CRISPR-associated endonuclease Cas1 [Corynebacterium phocae]